MSSRREPVPDTQPRCISAGGSGVGARGVCEQDVGKQGFGKRDFRKRFRILIVVRNAVVQEDVVRELIERKSLVREPTVWNRDEGEDRVWEKVVRKRGSVQGVAVRRPCCQCRIPVALHELSLPRGCDIKVGDQAPDVGAI